mmetsp:Transcript_18377/g.50162  ORF Transcript_18377/g.50162 Transcript_18377/m.50162 type:complete len:209 (+) Transcript_18377:5888-6514(+)
MRLPSEGLLFIVPHQICEVVYFFPQKVLPEHVLTFIRIIPATWHWHKPVSHAFRRVLALFLMTHEADGHNFVVRRDLDLLAIFVIDGNATFTELLRQVHSKRGVVGNCLNFTRVLLGEIVEVGTRPFVMFSLENGLVFPLGQPPQRGRSVVESDDRCETCMEVRRLSCKKCPGASVDTRPICHLMNASFSWRQPTSCRTRQWRRQEVA